MDPRKQAFLTAVLGSDGSGALMKAVERSAVLEYALVPRTILAWIQSGSEHDGELPGIEGSFACFALGIEPDQAPTDLRDLDLERLGKSIDAIAKLRFVTRTLEKSDEPEETEKEPCPICGSVADETCEHKVKKEELEKGAAAAPQAPKPPKPPAAAGSAPKPSLPKTPKPPTTIKMTKAEVARVCSACGLGQFKDGKFHGCICFRAMNKAVKVTPVDAGGFNIELDPRVWDKGDVVTFLEAVGRK